MGQRTQVLITRKFSDGKKQNKLYHIQWGFGRAMYLGLMDIFTQVYFERGVYAKGEYPRMIDMSHLESWHDISHCLPDNVSADDIKSVDELFQTLDNNNGGLCVMIEDNDNLRHSTISYGFLIGTEGCSRSEYENGDAFNHYITAEEYAKRNGYEFTNTEWMDIFNRFTDYFGLKYIGDKEEENKEENNAGGEQ